ncbi:MAG: RES domain-containing protein [Betaproteobacteria bacterium]|nr:RES domain-containing protein [Betaproteobacteria bacterium]
MILWRLSPARYATLALTGEGASLRGGRWNSRGVKAVYASLDPATTILEALTTFDLAFAPNGGFQLLKLSIPADVQFTEPPLAELPERWADWDSPGAAREYGDVFLKSGLGHLLIVPSAVLPQARNAVINPAHPQARKISIMQQTPFEFDPRWPLNRS